MKKYRRFSLPALSLSLLALSLFLLLGILFSCGEKTPQAVKDSSGISSAEGALTSQAPVSPALSYSNGSATLHFTCDESGSWHWRDDPAFPLDQSYLLGILDTVNTMMDVQPIPDATDAAAYGLDSKDKYLTTSGKNGEKLTFYFGSTTDSGAYYMMRSDVADQIYTAPAALTEQLNRAIFDMMVLPELPPFTAENVRTITLEGSGKVSLSFAQQEGTWHSGDATVDQQIPLQLLEEMSAMTVQSAIDYRPSPGVTGLCALDTPAAVLTITYANTVGVENTFTLQIGGVRGEGRYALINEDTTIYLIPSSQLTKLLTLAEQGI